MILLLLVCGMEVTSILAGQGRAEVPRLPFGSLSRYHALMAKATHEITKSRSRGTGTPVLVRLQPPFVERIDKWRAAQRDLPSRAEAMRRLAEIGLGTGSKRG